MSSLPELITVKARTGLARTVLSGQRARIANPVGSQVADVWAFALNDMKEFMSMEHSRLHMGRVNPVIGSTLFSNRRRPILTLVADTSSGVHDTLLAACDEDRYALLGYKGYHGNCTDNLHDALARIGRSSPVTPSPLNIFENAPPQADGSIDILPPVAPAGCFVELRAEMDIVLVVSACPQDMVATNGADLMPKDLHLSILM